MAESYRRWYRTGSVDVTHGSVHVTGHDTNWNTAGLHPGDIFGITSGNVYEIDEIVDNTHLKLKTSYPGDTYTNHSYYIVRNYTASSGAEIAAQATDLFHDVKTFIDGKQSVITGKSAYDIAVDEGYSGSKSSWVASLKGENAYQVAVMNGYTGTQAQWLESLKADNEWSTLNARTEILTYHSHGAHSSFFRGKYLGDHVTEEQFAHIADGSFEDLYVGDYWEIPAKSVTFTRNYEIDNEDHTYTYTSNKAKIYILDLNYYAGVGGGSEYPHLVLWLGGIYPWRVGNLESEILGCMHFGNPTGYANFSCRKTFYSFHMEWAKLVFGEEHIHSWTEYLATDTTGNVVSTTCKIENFSETQVLGFHSQSAYPLSKTEASEQGQFAFFRYRKLEGWGVNHLFRDRAANNTNAILGGWPDPRRTSHMVQPSTNYYDSSSWLYAGAQTVNTRGGCPCAYMCLKG